MYVSALDDAGAPVADLGPSDFVVREDNVAREVLRVAPADEPMQIAILVDNSQAARNVHPRHARGAAAVRRRARRPTRRGAKNEIAIIALGERPTILAELHLRPRRSCTKGIDRIFAQPGSGTYLLDGIIEVCQGFKKRDAPRPVIVAITTEGPELSNRQLRSRARRRCATPAPRST